MAFFALLTVLELILLWRASEAFFELVGKIIVVAVAQHIRDLANGVVAGLQPLGGELERRFDDVLIDGLLVMFFEHAAGIERGDVKMVGNVGGGNVFVDVFINEDPHFLRKGQILLFVGLEAFGNFKDHIQNDLGKLLQIVFDLQLTAQPLKALAEVGMANDHGVGQIEDVQQMIH